MDTENVLYGLSESQKSIWYLEKAFPGTSLNVVVGTLRMKGPVCYDALKAALNLSIRKNDALRLRLVERDGEAAQYVAPYAPFDIDYFDFSEGGLDALFAWDEGITKTPFDIDDKPLFYCAVYKVSEDEGGIYMKLHHLTSDAWTMGLMTKQIIGMYSSLKKGLPVDETPAPSFLEHLRSSAEYEKSARFERDRVYWNEKFDTIPDMTVLKPRKTGEQSVRARRKTMVTPLKLSRKIREFCEAHRLSVFTLFMSALSIYINRATGTEDIVLGTTILNRTNAREKETAGMFVSVAAPIRISVDDTMDFATFSKAMLRENTDVLRHQKYPYNHLIRDLKKKHKLTDRLFDIVLSFQNSKFQKNESEENYTAKWLFSGYQVESLIISINDREDGGNLIIDYDFLTDMFDIREIEFIHQHLISLLWHALDNPYRRIANLEMISEREKQTILREFNNTYADYPRDKTINQMFEEQVERTPDSVALLYRNEQMTYAELNRKANCLAKTLRKLGVGPDSIVGLMGYRSFEMIVGIMGVIKAGGAYMPIDPDYPDDRKKYMLTDSRAGVLLVNKLDKEANPAGVFDGIVIDLQNPGLYTGTGENLQPANSSGDLAYVIYTSGSTGKPKGVMIEHNGVVNSFCWGRKKFALDTDSIILQKTAFTFDPSVWEVFWWLMLGGKVCLVESGDEKDPEAIITAIEKFKVTTMHFVPSMLGLFLSYVETTGAADRLMSLKQVFSCGEAINIHQVQQFNKLLYEANGTELFNMYGPTEATVEVSSFDCSPEVAMNSVPIGRRIDNFKIFILDRNRNLLPVGIPGEIYISGAGVGRGYLNNPELTDERFVKNPFESGEIMYRTGDLARWYPRGDIEFLGRMDFQVKLKGFRIELGEIEDRLLAYDGITEAVVKSVKTENGDKGLVAYLVAEKTADTDGIRDYLASRLPEYMIPAGFVFLDAMPLNSNGKTDRNALPDTFAGERGNKASAQPENETENILATIWCAVLGLNTVGTDEKYASLGGDSLNAIKIVTEVHKALGVDISPKYVLQLQTIKKLSNFIRSKEADHLVPTIPKAAAAEYYPVSSAQKRLYILNQIDGGVGYNMPGGLIIEGPVDRDKIEEVLQTLAGRHETLRTSFELREGEPVQIVHGHIDVRLEYSEAPEAELEALAEAFIRPFDLGKAPLFRAGLVKLGENRCALLFDMHHIVSDGASVNILIGEIASLLGGETLPELRLQYKDYAVWQNGLLASGEIKKQETYWLERFSGELPALNMPLDYPRPSMQSFKGKRLRFSIGKELTAAARKLAAENGATLFMLLLSVYNVLLSKYSGQEDIIVGTPIAGRNSADVQGVVGMFVNTLAIRSYPAGEETFEDFLAAVKENLLRVYDNQDYPFEMLVDKVSVGRDMSRNPLFDTIFVMQNMELSPFKTGGLDIRPYARDSKTAKFDLTLDASDKGETIEYELEYCTDLFAEDTVRRFASHFENALQDAAENPAKRLKDIEILSEGERDWLLYTYNDTDADYPREKTIHQVFEERTRQTPDSIALIFDNQIMTYRELNACANRLARTLRNCGVGPDAIVGLVVNRSFEMIISILATIKAGGAYMPIDPDYPAERCQYMLDNSGAKVVLARREQLDGINCLCAVVDPYDESSYSDDSSNLTNVNKPSDLAYIIYTSGSTGRPKGVMTEHRNIVGLFLNDKFKTYQYNFNDSDIWLQFHSYCFDFSSFEIYGALLFGAKLVLIRKETAYDLNALHKLLTREKVTVLCQTPQSFYSFTEIDRQSQERLHIRYYVLGGESLKPALLRPMKTKYPSARIVNIYGPTETTILVTQKEYGIPEIEANISNIGRANPLIRAYILDHFGHLAPVGVTGELVVSGNGVSRGYINNRPLTEERFIHESTAGRGNYYRTGDYVRILPSGDLEYIGRKDDQIKIRGFRVELGEIQSQLLSRSGVDDAVVMVRTDAAGNKRIVAYYVTNAELPEDEIREGLSKTLPYYMIPSQFVRLAAIPLNPNGKVDRAALPDPETTSESDYQAPANDTERVLEDICKEVLSCSRISTRTSIFNLGCDSLNAVAISARISKEMGVEVTVRDIFKYQSIQELARTISKLGEVRFEEIPVIPKSNFYPVSSAQRRQYILRQIEGPSTGYNVPFALRLLDEIDPDRLENALRKLIDRHDSLRTDFIIRDGEPMQRVHDTVEFKLGRIRQESTEFDSLMASFVRPFELDRAPLLRVGLTTGDDVQYLLFDMHHIISDGVSIEIMVRELEDLYTGRELPPLRVQYKDYAAWHNDLLASDKIKRQEQYWLDKFSGELPVLSLPLDFARPAVQRFEGDRLRFEIDGGLSSQLRKLAGDTGATLFMVLLAAYKVLLSKYSGQEEMIVGTPVVGRGHADLYNIVGMFVNTIAIRSYPVGTKTFDEYLREIKEELLSAYDNQEYPFDKLVDKVTIRRDVSRNPLFDAAFVFQGTDLPKTEAEGFRTEVVAYYTKTSKFDLTLEARDKSDTIECGVEFSTALFKKETIADFIKHFMVLVRDIAANPAKRLCDLNILTADERRRLLFGFNDTAAEFPQDKTIHQIFEERAAMSPDRTALIFGGKTMTYRELNEKSNGLARTLREKGVGPDKIVGIMVERSFEMLIAIFAAIKAGGAYMPIDPNYPAERKQYMLEDSNAEALLTKRAYMADIAFNGAVIDLMDETCYAQDTSDLPHVNQPSDLAYVIYTSGSTGKPKGVMIEHRNVVRLLFNSKSQFTFGETDVWTMFHSYCFDFSVWEMYGALLYGGKLVIVSREDAVDTRRFAQLLEAEKVTVLNQTPSAFYNLIDADAQGGADLTSLRYVVFGGEALKPAMLHQFREKYPDVRLINMYGITETTVHVTFKELSETDLEKGISNVGKPIPTLQVFILDKYMNLVPIGVPGELYVSGAGVARGYLNNPELTKSKFVVNHELSNHTIYRSGDLGRFLINGDIEYLGRIDSQVKIRGYRIELGEVENALLSYPEVSEIVVTVLETSSGDKKLCAYYKANSELTQKELAAVVAKVLPNYMIPAYFHRVENMPLNHNGKIDKTKLPNPVDINLPKTMPRNVQDEMMANLWAEVLDVPSVGIDDDFFELGGDSLSAIKVISKLNINIVDFYNNSTIRKLSEKMLQDQVKTDLLVKLSTGNKCATSHIICFPYGGGSALSFRDMSESLRKKTLDMDLYAVNLPGHDYGTNEEFIALDNAAEKIADEIIGKIKGNIILYGQCAGSALLIATSRKLVNKGITVKAAYIGGILPPKFVKLYGWFYKPWQFSSDAAIIRYLKGIGLPKDLLETSHFAEYIIRAFRFDTKSYIQYFYVLSKSKEGKLNIPLHLIIGDLDITTKGYHNDYKLWGKYFPEIKTYTVKQAGHYFVNTHSDAVIDYILSNN